MFPLFAPQFVFSSDSEPENYLCINLQICDTDTVYYSSEMSDNSFTQEMFLQNQYFYYFKFTLLISASRLLLI